MKSKIDNIIKTFDEKKLKYNDAIAELDSINKIGVLTTQISSAKSKINNLNDSQTSYKNGKYFIDKKIYEEAVKELGKVIKDDSNYANAQTEIKNILPLLKNDKIQEADKNYKDKNIDGAISCIQLLETYIKDDTELKIKEEYYISEKEKMEKIEKERKEKRKQQILKLTNQYKDDISNSLSIVPKPFGKDLSIPSNSVVIRPILLISGDTHLLGVTFGFSQDDWIFTESIDCKADNENFSFNIPFTSRNSQVGWGAIYEWMSIDSTQDDFINIKKLAEANNTKIRFNGANTSRDYLLTQKDKERIKCMLELFELYE